MKGRRTPTRGEVDLWRRVTADVRPLTGAERRAAAAAAPLEREAEKIESVKKSAPPPSAVGKKPPPAYRAPTLALDPTRPIGIDRRSWERLKRGQVAVEKKLDLHGRTQAEAHAALGRFLSMASAAGLRCVLVVTGKGGIEGKGVLRQMVPRWLGEADNRDKVLTFCPAQPRHGGDGALYVLLRRRRDGRSRQA